MPLNDPAVLCIIQIAIYIRVAGNYYVEVCIKIPTNETIPLKRGLQPNSFKKLHQIGSNRLHQSSVEMFAT